MMISYGMIMDGVLLIANATAMWGAFIKKGEALSESLSENIFGLGGGRNL